MHILLRFFSSINRFNLLGNSRNKLQIIHQVISGGTGNICAVRRRREVRGAKRGGEGRKEIMWSGGGGGARIDIIGRVPLIKGIC